MNYDIWVTASTSLTPPLIRTSDANDGIIPTLTPTDEEEGWCLHYVMEENEMDKEDIYKTVEGLW